METEVIKIRDYQDYLIRYDSALCVFEAVNGVGEVVLKAETEPALRLKIDAAIKRSMKVKKSNIFPMEVIIKKYEAVMVGKITSIAEDGGYWISYENKGETKRSKELASYTSVYEVNPENLETIRLIKEKDRTIDKLRKEIDTLRYSFTKQIFIDNLVSKMEA